MTQRRLALPKSWCSACVGDTGQYINGFAFKPAHWDSVGTPIIRIKNLTDPTREYKKTTFDAPASARIQPGDILVSWAATLDAFLWKGEPAFLNWHIFRVVPDERLVRPKFLFYLLKWVMWELARTEHLHGSTSRHINRGPLMSFPVAIPPMNEQISIVHEIEKHFTRLDAAVDALKRVKANLRRYRAATLKAACEGRLVPTEASLARRRHRAYESASLLLGRILADRRSRMKNGRSCEPTPPVANERLRLPEGWTRASIRQVSFLVQYGSSAKTNENPDGIPVLRMGNLTSDGRIDSDELKYLPRDHDDFPALLLDSGDLLFNRTNSAELVGKSAVYSGNPNPCSFASYLIRVKMLPGCDSRYVALCFNSILGRAWIKSVVSQQVGQANVNGTKLQAFAIPLPPKHEQARILAEVERRLFLVDKQEALIDEELVRAPRLRQAILKKFFCGGLIPRTGTTNLQACFLRESVLRKRVRGGSLPRKRIIRETQPDPLTFGNYRQHRRNSKKLGG